MQPIRNHFRLHRWARPGVRVACMLAIIAACLGMLGHIAHQLVFPAPPLDAWTFHIVHLLHQWTQGRASLQSWFHTQDDVYPGLGLAWVMLGHGLNLGWWDVSWQWVWGGLWRVVMLAVIAWVLMAGQRRLEAWLIALAVLAVGLLPYDWASLFSASGPGQWMAIIAGVLAARAWLSPEKDRWKNKRGWAWFIAGLACSPTIAPLAIVCGLAQWLKARQHPPENPRAVRHIAQHACVTMLAGVLALLAAHAFWPGAEPASLREMARSFVMLLADPFNGLPGLGLVLWLPWLGLAMSMRKQPSRTISEGSRSGRWLVLALGGWVLLMFVLMAMHAPPRAMASHWSNTAALPLGVVVNMTALMALLAPSRWQRQATVPLDALMRTSLLQKKWLLVLWLILLSLGLWQDVRSDRGFQGLEKSASTSAAISQATQAYLATGDADSLQSLADHLSPVTHAKLKAVLDDPAMRQALPRTMLPPLRFSRYQTAGEVILPSKDQWADYTQIQPLGMIKPGPGTRPATRLGLLYELPQDIHWLMIQSRTRTVFPDGFELRVVNGDHRQELIGPDHPLPLDSLIINSLVPMPLKKVFPLRVGDRRLEIHLSTPSMYAPAAMVVYSPQPIGPMRWGLMHLLPWAMFLQGLGMAAFLCVGSWRWLTRAAACAAMKPRVPWRFALPATLMAAAVILLVRKPDALLNPQFWAEDGSVFFADHFHRGWLAVLQEYQGYMHLTPRLIAAIAGSLLPYAWLPWAYNDAAGAIMLAVIAAFFSPRLPFSLGQKCIMALSTVLVVQYMGEIFLTPTNLQWCMAPLLVLTLFKRAPDASHGSIRLQWLADISTLIVVGLTGPFVVLMMPIALLVLAVKRNRHVLVMTGVMALCAAVHGWTLLHHPSTPPVTVTTHALSWVIPQIISQRMVKDLLEPGLVGFYLWPWANCVVLALLLGLLGHVAYRNRPLRLMLAVCLVFMTLALLAGLWRNKEGLLFFVLPSASRYFHLPMLMLIWCIVLMLGSCVRWHRQAAAVLLALALSTSLLTNFVSKPWQDLGWPAVAREIQAHPDTERKIPVHPTSLNLMIHLNPSAGQKDASNLDDAQRRTTREATGQRE